MKPEHGSTWNHALHTHHDPPRVGLVGNGSYFLVPGSSLTVSRSDRYCARCGWIEVVGISGALRWILEHEAHGNSPNAVVSPQVPG